MPCKIPAFAGMAVNALCEDSYVRYGSTGLDEIVNCRSQQVPTFTYNGFTYQGIESILVFVYFAKVSAIDSDRMHKCNRENFEITLKLTTAAIRENMTR